MTKKDFFFALAASLITAVFLYPTLQTTGFYTKLNYPLEILFIAFPIISIAGMAILHALGKKFPILWQFAKFAQVGVLNTVIDFGFLNLLIASTQITSGPGIILVNAISFTIALINSYWWNKNWVFGGAKKANFVTFVGVTLVGLLINTGMVYGVTTYITPVIVTSAALWANLAKALATVLSLIWNFAGYKVIVFKPSKKK